MTKLLSILLPHSDDEIFVLPLINKKILEGYRVHIFFMTTDLNPKRKNESEKVFSDFQNTVLYQFGHTHSLPDGHLRNHSKRAFSLLEKEEIILNSEILITPILEGGHVDHDEVFKLGYELSTKYHKPLLCFSLYNGYQTFFVRVATIFQGPVKGVKQKIDFSLYEGLRYLRKSFSYKSQLIILGVLLPGMFRTFLLKRKIDVLLVENYCPETPHPGKLFYENDLKIKVKRWLGMAK